MIDVSSFQGAPLRGGYHIVRLELTSELMIDPLNRPALARTQIIGHDLFITVRSDLTDEEISISIYHEVLEAMTLAVDDPPDQLQEFNEGAFEKAGKGSHDTLGFASPDRLNAMLQFYDFPK